MILVGFICPNCGGQVLDSLDHCHHCKQPYTGTLAVVALAHHDAKMRMVGTASVRIVTEEEVDMNTTALASASEGLAFIQKMGVEPPSVLIADAFASIVKG